MREKDWERECVCERDKEISCIIIVNERKIINLKVIWIQNTFNLIFSFKNNQLQLKLIWNNS